MKNLSQYLTHENYRRIFTGETPLTVKTLTPADVARLLNRIENDLSPENLSCDGEIRGAALQTKLRLLMGAKKDLEKLAIK